MEVIQGVNIASNLLKKRNNQAQASKPVLQQIVEVPATVFDVGFRREFGEGYFPPLRWFACVVFILTWILVSRDTQLFGEYQDAGIGIGDGQSSSYLQVLAVVVFGWGIWHLWRIAARNHAGIFWNPECTGISWLDLGNERFVGDNVLPPQGRLDDWRIYKLIEPVTAFVLAWLASIIELELGVFFLVCAICFTIRNLLVFTTNRNAYLQAIKEIIEKRWMHAKAVGRDKRRMEGFSPTTISPRMQAELSRRMLEDIEQDIERMFVQNTTQAA